MSGASGLPSGIPEFADSDDAPSPAALDQYIRSTGASSMTNANVDKEPTLIMIKRGKSMAELLADPSVRPEIPSK